MDKQQYKVIDPGIFSKILHVSMPEDQWPLLKHEKTCLPFPGYSSMLTFQSEFSVLIILGSIGNHPGAKIGRG